MKPVTDTWHFKLFKPVDALFLNIAKMLNLVLGNKHEFLYQMWMQLFIGTLFGYAVMSASIFGNIPVFAILGGMFFIYLRYRTNVHKKMNNASFEMAKKVLDIEDDVNMNPPRSIMLNSPFMYKLRLTVLVIIASALIALSMYGSNGWILALCIGMIVSYIASIYTPYLMMPLEPDERLVAVTQQFQREVAERMQELHEAHDELDEVIQEAQESIEDNSEDENEQK